MIDVPAGPHLSLNRQRQRKDAKAKFFAKTRRGQPIMKHRLDKILEALNPGKKG
jgi:hypothetical protein